jgi:LysM repeat protein
VTPERNRPRISQPLIYLGIVALVFLCGTLFGLVVLGRWLFPPAPPTPEVALITVTSVPAGVSPQATPAAARQPTATQPPTPACGAIPVEWMRYTVQAGDTLSELAAEAGVSQEHVMQANCLASPELRVGQQIYLPPTPTPTPCVPSAPSGWVLYTVQAGDTLFSLAAARGTTADEVMRVNCLSSSEIVTGQQFYLPPTPCTPSPPTGWELYTVQAGDTLFGLGAARGTTVDEVMQVNCLSSPDIVAGQQLYLPSLPAPFATAPPVPAPQLTLMPAPAAPPSPPQGPAPQPVEPSAFSRRLSNLPEMPPLFPPSPGEGDACDWPMDAPWIHPFGGQIEDGEYQLERGTTAYFFACNFQYDLEKPPETTKLAAYMLGPDGISKTLDVRLYLPPHEYLRMGKAQGVVIWNAVCDESVLPSGSYTLVIEDGQGHKPEHPFSFKLKPPVPGKGSILAMPQVAPTGTTFQVYYCNYPPETRVTIDLYYQVAITQTTAGKSGLVLEPADSWDVFTNKYGWTTRPLPSSKGDPDGPYWLQDRDKELSGWYIVWLLR